MNTSLRPTRAPKNATKARTDGMKQGRKYGWFWRYDSFPNVSGQRTAGLENTPPMMGLELEASMGRSYSPSQSNLRKCYTHTPYNGHIGKRICHICSVRYLECCQLQSLITLRSVHSPPQLPPL